MKSNARQLQPTRQCRIQAGRIGPPGHRAYRSEGLVACGQRWLGVLLLWCVASGGTALGQVKIWEFSPYEVEVWYSFDASVTVSAAARENFIHQLDSSLNRTFRSAWSTHFTPMPARISGRVRSNFANLELDDLTHNELVLVISAKHPDTKTLRTFEAAAEGLTEIYVSADAKRAFDASLAEFPAEDESPTMRLGGKLVVEADGVSAIKEKLLAGTIAGAFIPRSELDASEKDLRAVTTMLPWQAEAVFRQRDKLFFLLVGMQGDAFTFQVRELDCPMQFIGEAFGSSTLSWPFASRVATAALVSAFAPVARVEDAEAKSAIVRHRAGGLIVNDQNPARIRVGDVLQPIIRRDDRNGVPTLLEPLPFTFAAVTESDGVKMDVNVYSYSGGPGLQGRKNRRTQRVLLRVRPRFDSSDLQITVRGGNGRTQAGCFVYDRNWLTEEFELLGRTDWRGRFAMPIPAEFGGLLPEAIRKERFLAKQVILQAARDKEAAEKAAAEAARTEGGEGATPTAATPAATTPQVAEIEEIDPNNDPAVIALNYPLLQLYIKNGDNVLAKLPMVPGLQEIEVAELPDDSLRLESEAFVRGFQGEILDLIGLRNLLAARVRLYIKDDRLDKAVESLDELRELKTYNEMADELSLIQNRMLEEAGDEVPYSAKVKIDRMFQTTRDMLQKYLQDNLVVDAEKEYEAAGGGTKPSATTAAAN